LQLEYFSQKVLSNTILFHTYNLNLKISKFYKFWEFLTMFWNQI
jgi:hypothetical protein